MKIRLQLADAVLLAATRSAADDGLSLDEFVERSLCQTLNVPPDAMDAGWDRLLAGIYGVAE